MNGADGYSRIVSSTTALVVGRSAATADAGRSVARAALRLGPDGVLDLGMAAEQVQGEGQRRGRRLVAGQQEDEHLVADLGVGEPGVAVAGGQQAAQEVRATGLASRPAGPR